MPTTPSKSAAATGEHVRRILGDLDADVVAAILALRPTVRDLEEAAAALEGDGEVLRKGGVSLTKVAADIADILLAEEEEEERR
jgi:hypothetical protein